MPALFVTRVRDMGQGLMLRFTLPSSSYATMALRQLLRADTSYPRHYAAFKRLLLRDQTSLAELNAQRDSKTANKRQKRLRRREAARLRRRALKLRKLAPDGHGDQGGGGREQGVEGAGVVGQASRDACAAKGREGREGQRAAQSILSQSLDLSTVFGLGG